MNIRIRQAYYSLFHKPFLQKGFVPYFNAKASPYMESRILADLYESNDHRGSDYYGLVSWRFKEKTKKNFEQIHEAIISDRGKTDVFGFRCMELGIAGRGEHIWRVAYPRLQVEIAKRLFGKMGYPQDVLDLKGPIIYCNFWAARTRLFERYMKEMLLPAMRWMEEDPLIRELCGQDSKYKPFPIRRGYWHPLYSKRPLSRRRCRQVFGKPYYTFHPFVCERLFSSWLALNPDISHALL